MQTLIKSDLQYIVRRLPRKLATLMQSEQWYNKIFVGGGFIRAIIAGETINDIDVFVTDKKDADVIAAHLAHVPSDIHKTNNAITIKAPLPIQVITRWVFAQPADVANSFDFTVCCSVVYFNGVGWQGLCDPNFYPDLAGKRLVYRVPVRNEDAGGSILRVLKYYQRGYRIPLNCLAAVIARLIKNLNTDLRDEVETAKVITGFLFEVDPNTVMHEAYLPATESAIEDFLFNDPGREATLKGLNTETEITVVPEADVLTPFPEDALQKPAGFEDIHDKVRKYLQSSRDAAGARNKVKDILGRFGCKTLSHLHPDDYGAFNRAFDALK